MEHLCKPIQFHAYYPGPCIEIEVASTNFQVVLWINIICKGGDSDPLYSQLGCFL